MARQECNNTFSDGLMMDLNPINTPKSVLTDCLNGTYITYNGNEFVLQNDMGNYELQNCKLKPNFIPVGIKGYGDILYIVSYNPITKQTEIGSYPAPQSRMSVEQETNQELVNTDYYTFTGTNDYTTVLKDDKELSIFINSSNEESMKLYPGDEFQLNKSDEANPDFYWQTLNYYIIDENKKQYDIDDTIINENIGDKTKVFWEVPGWLANKWVILVPQKFTLNIRNIELPSFISEGSEQIVTTITVNTQITVEDSQFINVYNEYPDDVGIKYEIIISSDKDNVTEQEVWGLNKHNYNDDTLTLYNNWSTAVSAKLNNNITIKATPGVRSGTRILWYDQFTTDFSFSLNSIKDVSDITIADSVYKWQIDDNSCTVTFNVNGPFINSDNYRAYYRLRRWNEQKNLTDYPYPDIHTTPSTIIDNRDDFKDDYSGVSILESNKNFTWISDWTPISNFIPYGENIIDIPFSTNNVEFYREAGLYDFSILITELNNIETQNTDEIIGTPLKQVNLLLIPSVTFNSFYNQYDNYMTQVSGSQWISRYMEFTDLSTFKLYSWEQAIDSQGNPRFNTNPTTTIDSSEYSNVSARDPYQTTTDEAIKDWLTRHPYGNEGIQSFSGVMKDPDKEATLFSNMNVNTLKYIFNTDAILININGDPTINYLGKGYEKTSLWSFYSGQQQNQNEASITYDLKDGGVRVFSETMEVNSNVSNLEISPELSMESEITYSWSPVPVPKERQSESLCNTETPIEYSVARDRQAGVCFLDPNNHYNQIRHTVDRSISKDDGQAYARDMANAIGDYGIRIMRITASPRKDAFSDNGLVVAKRIGIEEGHFPFNEDFFTSNVNATTTAGDTTTSMIGIVARALVSAYSNSVQAVFIPVEITSRALIYHTPLNNIYFARCWKNMNGLSDNTRDFVSNLYRIKHRIFDVTSTTYQQCTMNAPSLEDTIDVAITQYDVTFKIEENSLYYGVNNWHNSWISLLRQYATLNGISYNSYNILPKTNFIQEWSKVIKNVKFSETSASKINLNPTNTTWTDWNDFCNAIKNMCDDWNSQTNNIDMNVTNGLYIDTSGNFATEHKDVYNMYSDLVAKLSVGDVNLIQKTAVRFDNSDQMNTVLLTRERQKDTNVPSERKKADCDLCLRYHFTGTGWLSD